MTPKEWYDKKRLEFKNATGSEWRHIDPWGGCGMASYCYETMMRMNIERSYFNMPTQDEDVMIANAIMIKERLSNNV